MGGIFTPATHGGLFHQAAEALGLKLVQLVHGNLILDGGNDYYEINMHYAIVWINQINISNLIMELLLIWDNILH